MRKYAIVNDRYECVWSADNGTVGHRRVHWYSPYDVLSLIIDIARARRAF